MKMRHLTILFLLVFALLPFVYQSTAQDEDTTCGSAAIETQVQEAYTRYERDANANDNLALAMDTLTSFQNELDEIFRTCDDVRFQAYFDEGIALLEELRAGGYVIYVRHAATDRSQGDTDVNGPCDLQRNLNEQGRIDSREIGEAFAILGVSVDQLISTQLCRALETAQLAFGEPDLIIERIDLEMGELDSILRTPPADGSNTIVVAHIGTIQQVTGINIPQDARFEEGDSLLYRPSGGEYELVGRISVQNWFDLARIAAMLEDE